MAIEDILKKIEEETEAECEKILAEAKAEAEKISREYSERAENLKKTLFEKAEARAKEEEKRLIVNEQLALRKALLSKKGELLEKVYSSAKERIKALPEKEYLEVISRLVLTSAISGTEELVVPKSQRELFSESFLISLNDRFGDGAKFTISQEAGKFDWGVILREKQREIDLTLDVIFAQIIEKIEPRIAEVLFEGIIEGE